MRSLLHPLLMILIAVILTGGLAIPHICLEDDSASVKSEQPQLAKAANSHQDASNTSDHCCIAHHCCFAKLVTPDQTVSIIAFAGKVTLFTVAAMPVFSFDPKGLDRPPKSFA